MNTQTHIIMGAALMGRGVSGKALAGALGGVAPDLPMLLLVLALKLMAIPDPIIFGLLYWQEWWQRMNAIAHNFWLWGGLVILALVMRDRLLATKASFDRWTLVAVFAGSALLHTAVDFLVHREDAHMSLWPVTRWKFISPVSYWDRAHYGNVMSLVEITVGLALAVILYRQFRNIWVRVALSFTILLYLAVPAYFMLH